MRTDLEFTLFGNRFTGASGILQLMDDLGKSVEGSSEVIMLGGGNPSHIPSVQQRFRARMQTILANNGEFEQLIGNYSHPAGDKSFLTAVATLLREAYGWNLTEKNIVLTSGSQTAFFYLFNLLAGQCADGIQRKILLPLAPEYIGYEDVGIADNLFIARRPEIEYQDEHIFKYHVDFDALEITSDIGAICVSRPTNPTGNVLTDREITELHKLAQRHQIPLIIDNAYGAPFPDIIFDDVTPVWDEQIVLCLSLSKLGLPGTRTGIIVARESIISAVAGMNAVLSLAPSSFGALLALEMVRSGEIIQMSRDLIRPYYHQRALQAQDWVMEYLAGTSFCLHKPEGAFFFWLWFKDLPISCAKLYERLKQRGVIIVPGHYFFPGLEENWAHKHECIRINYTQAQDKVREGIRIIGEEVKRAWRELIP